MPDTKRTYPHNFIKHKGLFDFNQLLRDINKFGRSRRYDFFEKKHKHKPDEREVELYMQRKINEYVRYRIDLLVRTWNMKEVEIVQEGRVRKLNEGRLAVEIWGTLEMDWQKRFGGSKFLQNLQDIMHKTFLKRTIEDTWEAGIMIEVNKLMHAVHESIGMEKGVIPVG